MKLWFSSLLIVTGLLAAAAEGIPQQCNSSQPRTKDRDETFAEHGEVDLYVASTAGLNLELKKEDERFWLPAYNLGKRIVDATLDVEGDRQPRGPTAYKTFALYCSNWKPGFFRQDIVKLKGELNATGEPKDGYRQVIQARNVETVKGLGGLVVARGSVRVKVSISDALILTNDSILTEGSISKSVIVCDGDVKVEKNIYGSIIIARGDIRVSGFAETSTLIVGGKVIIKKPKEPLMDPRQNFRDRTVIEETEANPLGFITFFELHRIGLEVKVADEVVTVTKVAVKSECEKAGLKVGDVILEAAGKKPTDVESLRRLLRDALAIGDASVKLKRGDETLSVKVALPE